MAVDGHGTPMPNATRGAPVALSRLLLGPWSVYTSSPLHETLWDTCWSRQLRKSGFLRDMVRRVTVLGIESGKTTEDNRTSGGE